MPRGPLAYCRADKSANSENRTPPRLHLGGQLLPRRQCRDQEVPLASAVEAFKGLIHPSFLDRYIVLKGMPASLSSRPKQV